ncbi:MAG: Cysteine desulfurase [Chlamydiae bacterium]|nr:Cysteine desulfurase [Chlamydiota bacterium]
MRKYFPQLENTDLIYLDSAATTLKPKVMIDAITQFYAHEYGTVHRGVYQLCQKATTLYQDARQTIKDFIHAESEDEIIVTKNTTEAINLVASTFIKPKDHILITEIEHHSNIVPWQLVCQKIGATLDVVRVLDSGDLDLEDLEKKLKKHPKLFSLAHISNTIGTKHPIHQICKLCHAHNTHVLIDAAQSIANTSIDVQQIDCDFLCFSGHKMYGPTGIGILYGKKELLNAMPPFLGGGDMIESVTNTHTTFGPLPLKFEAGTPPIAEMIGLKAAIDFIKTHKTESLTNYALEKLQTVDGIKILGAPRERGELISFVHEKYHPLDIATLLDTKNIAIRSGHLCAMPALKRFFLDRACRISFGLYNTKEDIDQFSKALKNVMRDPLSS